VLLRYLIGDVPSHAAGATALMERLEAGTELAEVLETVIAEAAWTLESFYEVPRPQIAEKLAAVLTFPGVRTPRKGLLVRALARFGSTSADFVDCLLAATAERRNLTIYSFDARDFRRLGVAWEAPA
jgi:predicted nucleic acid-binding protein